MVIRPQRFNGFQCLNLDTIAKGLRIQLVSQQNKQLDGNLVTKES